MFDRFTPRGRKVMGLARQEAQRLHHDHIGTEHILLGLVQEGSGVAARVLGRLDVDLDRIRQEAEKLVSTGTTLVTVGPIPLTPHAKNVLALALQEASKLGHMYLGTEHLLLGLIHENEGIAAQVLRHLKVDAEDVREEILDLLGTGPDGREEEADGAEEDDVEGATPLPDACPLSDAARALVEGAKAEAARLGHDWVENDHLLTVTLRDESLAEALSGVGIDVPAVLRPAESRLRATSRTASRGELPDLSPAARDTVRLAAREATRFGSASTDPAHVLWALLGTGNDLPEEKLEAGYAVALTLCGLKPGRVAAEIETRRSSEGTWRRSSVPRPAPLFAPFAAQALMDAVGLARRLGDLVSPVHILFGVARAVPADARLTHILRPVTDLGRVVELEIAPLAREAEWRDDVRMSPAALAVLSRALASAAARGASVAEVEDLFLAVVTGDGGAACEVLTREGVDFLALAALLGKPSGGSSEAPPRT